MIVASHALPLLASAGGGGEPVGPLTFQPGLVFWTFVTLCITMWLLNRMAWGPILRQLADRDRIVEDDRHQAVAVEKEARTVLTDYEARLDVARQAARGTLERAKEEALEKVEQKLGEVRSASEAKVAEARKKIAEAKRKALEKMEKEAEGLADEVVAVACREV